jgi:SAM-dependent methyltransferase
VRDTLSRARFARWRVEPLCPRGGSTRGITIHRTYLDDFLTQHARDIHGQVLEFEEDVYATKLGTPASVDVLNIDASNPAATIVADLTRPNAVESDRFDAIVCTHVLHLVSDPAAVVRELHRLLVVGGVLLVATPFVCPVKPGEGERWRFTAQGMEELLRLAFDDVEVVTYGNSLAAAALLRGLTAHELGEKRLWPEDPRFTVEVCARAVKH